MKTIILASALALGCAFVAKAEPIDCSIYGDKSFECLSAKVSELEKKVNSLEQNQMNSDHRVSLLEIDSHPLAVRPQRSPKKTPDAFKNIDPSKINFPDKATK